MAVEIRVPSAGESINEVYIGPWKKGVGERVEQGEILVELETDKATLELPAPVAGVIAELKVGEGDRVEVGAVIAVVEEGSVAGESGVADEKSQLDRAEFPEPAEYGPPEDAPNIHLTPSARHLLRSKGLSLDELIGRAGPATIARAALARMSKEEILAAIEELDAARGGEVSVNAGPSRTVREQPMTPIRTRIAERLVEAQHTGALLTTFNEVDMERVIALRKEHQEAFTAKHGVKLGFMSFFVKASVAALREFPQINGQIVETERGPAIRYHDYCDIGIAIGGGKGLVVPVLRNAESMRFAEIEKAIVDFAARAGENKIGLDELQGGTFTISNGGVYGSLLSTPIINPPQSGILGLHAIQDRPVAIDGQVVIRKMMYVALTYDHRIVDGREAVTFLRRIKECIENPERLMFDL